MKIFGNFKNFLKIKLERQLKFLGLIDKEEPISYRYTEWKKRSFFFIVEFLGKALILNYVVFIFFELPFTVWTVLAWGFVPDILKNLREWVR